MYTCAAMAATFHKERFLKHTEISLTVHISYVIKFKGNKGEEIWNL